MARRLTVEPATQAHAAQLAAHLRPEDAAEMMASHGLGPDEGCRLALRHSTTALAMLDGPRVVALFGVAPVPNAQGIASVWCLAARLVKRVSRAFMRTARQELRKLAGAWGVLFNAVSVQNVSALRWVRAMGFEVLEPIPFGVSGEPFHPICLRR